MNYSVCGIFILQVVDNQLGIKLYEIGKSGVHHFPWNHISNRFIVRYDRNGRITVVTVSNIPFITMGDMFSSLNSYVLHRRYGFLGGWDVEDDQDNGVIGGFSSLVGLIRGWQWLSAFIRLVGMGVKVVRKVRSTIPVYAPWLWRFSIYLCNSLSCF